MRASYFREIPSSSFEAINPTSEFDPKFEGKIHHFTPIFIVPKPEGGEFDSKCKFLELLLI